MATTKKNKSNNVKATNATATATATAKVENESNESTNNVATDESASTESKQESATAPTSATDENATDENATDESAKVENESKQILIDVTLESDTYKIKHANEINKRYKSEEPQQHESDNWQHGKLIAIYRPIENRVNSDKTFYKIEYNGIIFDGYTNTEFCDANGIERKHRAGSKSAPKAITLLDKLQALKNAIEAVGSEEENFVNFAKIVAQKIESEQLESQRAEFVAKYSAAITFFPKLTEQDFVDENGADDLALALKLGYKFKDTKQDTTTESK